MADPEDGRMNGEHPDEGVVHAWLDGQLSAADAARIEAHIAGCAACAEMVAEARGFVAASSRILTGLDGVPARVVPRSRSRARIWQVRAAAAVLVVALGAAAVLSDTRGHFNELRRETGISQPPPVAAPAQAAAKTADTVGATPPATLAKTRGAVPAPVPQRPQPEQLQSERVQAQQLQSQQHQAGKKEAAANERDAARQRGAVQSDAVQSDAAPQAATPGAQAVPPVGQNTPAGAPPPAMRSAFSAKAAPSAVGGNAMQQMSDSSASAGVARAFSVRRLASNAAYGRCVGKVVTVSEPAGPSVAARLTTVRLDSVVQSPPVRGFVVAVPGGRANLDGWWVPAGSDSAVVSLAGAEVVSKDSAARDTSGLIPATVTRVQCPSQ